MISYPTSVGGVRTRVFEAGDGGTPLVLLHGLTSRADRWARNIDPLAVAGYRVYALDLPGHGFADKDPAYDHSIAGYRDFIVSFLDQIEAERAILVGTSLGGHVMAAVACQDPGRVQALVMIGSLGLRAVSSERVGQIRNAIADMSPAAMRGRLLSVFTDTSLVTDDLVAEDIRINTSPGAERSLGRFIDYMAERFNDDLVLDPLIDLGDGVPLLLYWGVEDKSAPVEIARAARAKLPHARLVVVTNDNHTPYMERPELFNRIVVEFITGKLGAFTAPDVSYE